MGISTLGGLGVDSRRFHGCLVSRQGFSRGSRDNVRTEVGRISTLGCADRTSFSGCLRAVTLAPNARR